MNENLNCLFTVSSATIPIVLTNSSYGHWSITWSNTIQNEILIISNGTTLHQVSHTRALNLDEPNEDISWCLVDNYRAIYGLISQSEAQCTIEYGNSLFTYEIDSLFSNDTSSFITFSSVVPTVLRDAQTDEVTSIHIFGTGLTEEFSSSLKCYFNAGDEYQQIVTGNIISENILKCSIPFDIYQFAVASKSSFLTFR